MKKIAILLLFMACATTSVYAQDIQVIAEFIATTNIRQQNNGKLSLDDAQNKPIITDIDSIFPTSIMFSITSSRTANMASITKAESNVFP